MAFLDINGVNVPILQGGEISVSESNSTRGFSLNGTPGVGRSRTHRRFRFTTSFLPREDAMALLSMLMHEGDAFKFTPNSNAGIEFTDTTMLYSDKGYAPDSGETFAAYTARAADNSRVFRFIDTSTYEPITPYIDAGSAITAANTTSNLVSSNVSTGTSGFTAFGSATVTANTGFYWEGSESYRAESTASTTNCGFQVASAITAGVTGGNTYTFTAFVKLLPNSLANNRTFTIGTVEVGPGTTTTTSYNIDVPSVDHEDRWFMIQHTVTTQGSTTNLTLRVYLNSVTVEAGDFLYTDGWQVTETAAPRPWVEGGTTRAAGQLRYRETNWLSNIEGATLACWCSPYMLDATNIQRLVRIGDVAQADAFFEIYKNTNDRWYAQLTDLNAGYTNVIIQALSSVIASDDGWTHIAGTADFKTGTTKLYVNGTLVSTATPGATSRFRLNRFTLANGDKEIFIAQGTGKTAGSPGPVADVMVIPAVLSDDQILTMATMDDTGYGIGCIPLHVQGNALPAFRYGMKAIANVSAATIQSIHFSGTEDMAQQITFDLLEYVEPL